MPTNEYINPFHFNVIGTLQRNTPTKNLGQNIDSWATATGDQYTGMRMQQLNSRGSESYESMQQVAQLKGSFVMRKDNREIVPATDRIVVDSKNYYVEGVRPWKSSNKYIVVDWIYKDNG